MASQEPANESVILRQDGPVAVISLNRPEQRNAFAPEMARRLIEICEEVDRSDAIGAAVVRGEGKGFCAGADRAVLARAGADPVGADNYRDLGSIYEAFMRLGRLRVPSIAAVRGSAVGAGLNLMMSADLRIVAEDARLIAGFLRIGIHPGGGHFRLLNRAVGAEAAAAMALFGEELSGQQAARRGLAWQALADDEVDGRSLELAHRAAKDPELARTATHMLRKMTAGPVDWDIAMEAERSAQMWSLRRRSEREALGDSSPE